MENIVFKTTSYIYILYKKLKTTKNVLDMIN